MEEFKGVCTEKIMPEGYKLDSVYNEPEVIPEDPFVFTSGTHIPLYDPCGLKWNDTDSGIFALIPPDGGELLIRFGQNPLNPYIHKDISEL